jgi:prenyltransferase beta subunit
MRLIVTLTVLALAAAPGYSADKEATKVKIDDDVKKATAKAYEWLAAKQNNDGSWGDSRYPNNTAITGFALMAFMSQGHVPNQGKYGPEVAKGCRFIIASQRESDGYLVGSRGGNMYCHGMATLALSQLWGMTGDEDVKKALEKAVKLIIKCQSPDGGWRYEPVPSGSDISVTIMQVMALRGAKDSGLHVPDKTMKKALDYINSCYDRSSGGYTYQPYNRAPGFARTAAGLCVLKLLGEVEIMDEESGKKVKVIEKYGRNVETSLQYLKASMDRPREHFWYGHYYACHAMHQIGGKDWEEYYATIKKRFIDMQLADGSWSRQDLQSAGPVYQTSIAIIALSIPANYLPIFQR